MHDIEEKLGIKNMSDLIMKAIKGIDNTKNPTKKNKQIRKYKRYVKEFIDYLTGIYIHEDYTLSIIMDCRTPAAIEFRTN